MFLDGGMLRGATLPCFAAALVCAGCGSSQTQSAVAPAASSETSLPPPAPSPTPVADESPHALPTECADSAMCTPPKDFGERICSGSYPDAALSLFGPRTPWKRAYLRRAFQAWHVGGHGEMRELHTNEEVLVLTVHQAGDERMQIGGRAFDVLRWDGTCVSLMEDEINFQKPPGAVPANIVWKSLDSKFQAALTEEKAIDMLHANQVRACDAPDADKEPGKTKCEIAREQLSLAIAQWVARTKTLPAPSSIP